MNQQQTSFVSKANTPSLFDRLNNIISSTYREVFNAWDPTESNIFVHINTLANSLVGLLEMAKPKPSTLQLIPIRSQQRHISTDTKHLENNGHRSI